MALNYPNTELTILSRIIAPDKASLPREAASAFLALAFAREDVQRMNELAESAREGNLTPNDQDELDHYERVGHMLSLLHSKARMSLSAAAKS